MVYTVKVFLAGTKARDWILYETLLGRAERTKQDHRCDILFTDCSCREREHDAQGEAVNENLSCWSADGREHPGCRTENHTAKGGYS